MSRSGRGWLIVGGGLAALVSGYSLWRNRERLFANDITSGESSAYPTLRSRVYYADAARVISAADQALRRMPRWKVISRDPENEALEAEVGAPISLFTDDVTVYAIPLGHGQTRVTIRSRSRSGRGDLGRNAAHIRELQRAMDDRLNADAAF